MQIAQSLHTVVLSLSHLVGRLFLAPRTDMESLAFPLGRKAVLARKLDDDRDWFHV